MQLNLQLDASEPGQFEGYQELIGALMYLVVGTRPDLAFPVSYLSRFIHCSTSEHFAAAKRILRHVAGTIDFSLCYRKSSEPIHTYVDADGHKLTM